jgi:hypothetical protein
MAFTDAEKVQIRRWMGGSFLFINIDQRLESAMTTVENLPDSAATEDYITNTLLVQLAATDTQLQSLRTKFLALDADEVKIDAVRAMGALRSEGRRYSQQLAHSLGFNAILRDPWSMSSPDPTQQLGAVAGLPGTR